MKVTLFIII